MQAEDCHDSRFGRASRNDFAKTKYGVCKLMLLAQHKPRWPQRDSKRQPSGLRLCSNIQQFHTSGRPGWRNMAQNSLKAIPAWPNTVRYGTERKPSRSKRNPRETQDAPGCLEMASTCPPDHPRLPQDGVSIGPCRGNTYRTAVSGGGLQSSI
jgi:hypothetical protein